MSSPRAGTFIATKEHRRFIEFAEAVRKHRYVGLCYGAAGVGKTLSARRYANWDLASPFIENRNSRRGFMRKKILEALERSRTVFHTPTVMGTLRDLKETLVDHIGTVDDCINDHLNRHVRWDYRKSDLHVEMLIFDEAERLSVTCLEFIRDIFDRRGVGVILIGMPGMEKRLARYPQLYSRIGFVHAFRPLRADEIRHLLTAHWGEMGLALPAKGITDMDAVAAVIRITGGNFRLLRRLLSQIDRILGVNGLTDVTVGVVEAARESLVIGTA